MGKLWKVTIFDGKTIEHHHFGWENHGKSPFWMEQLNISRAIFNGVELPEGTSEDNDIYYGHYKSNLASEIVSFPAINLVICQFAM